MSYAYQGGQPAPPPQQQWYGGGPSSYAAAAHDPYGQQPQQPQHQQHQPAQPMMMGGYGGYGGGQMPAQGGGGGGGGWGGSMDSGGDEDYANEPPLLEELGINFGHIWDKTKTILLPIKVRAVVLVGWSVGRFWSWSPPPPRLTIVHHPTYTHTLYGKKKKTKKTRPHQPLDDHIMDDADLAGPLFFLLAFGVFLLLTGKVRPLVGYTRIYIHTHTKSLA